MKLYKRIWVNRMNYLFILPILLVYFIFAFLPIIQTFIMSFYNSKIISRGPFVGFENYKTILASSEFQQTLLNTLIYTVVSIIFSVSIALILAVFVNLRKLRLRTMFKVIIFLPVVTSPVAVGYTWRWILEPDHGIVNKFLSTVIGVEGPNWLSDKNLALWIVIMVNVWKWIGYFLVILYANLQLIDEEYYDAADLEGASPLQKFSYITVPLLKYAITLCVILGFVAFMRSFALVFVMTRGGPAGSTEVMVTYIYRKAFGTGQMEIGISSAASIVLFILIMIFHFLSSRISKRRGVDEDFHS